MTNFKNHNGRRPRIYNLWANIKSKCYCKTSPLYSYYGGRGIEVQKSWLKDYDCFYNYVSSLDFFDIIDNDGNKLSLDRIDNDGNYEEGNLRWADARTQRLNRRVFQNNTIGFIGVYKVTKYNYYNAFIYINNKTINLGCANTKIEAYLLRYNYIIDNKLDGYDEEIKLFKNYQKDNHAV